MHDEIFDVVDADDRVIGQATRLEVHARGLMHRAANVFVFNSQGRLLVQKRSASKDEFPLCYTSSASGHLDAGETYDACAARELQEELGLATPLERLGKFAATPENANEHTTLYRTVTDDTPTFHTGEIESVAYFDLDELSRMMEQAPDTFAPPFRVLFRWYMQHQADQGPG